MEKLGKRNHLENLKENDLSVQELFIEPENARALRDCLLKNNLSFDDSSEADIFEAGRILKNDLPPLLGKALMEMAAHKSQQAALLIRGLPIEPPIGKRKNGRESEILLAAIGSLLGTPFVADGHRGGHYFLDLIPNEADAAKELGTGTELQWHSEDAQLSNPPRFICLLGLRGDKNTRTLVSTVQVSALHSKLVSVLSKPLYTFLSDESYMSTHKEISPVISPDIQDLYRLRYDVKFTELVSSEASEAYQDLGRTFDKKSRSFHIKTGDLLVFNNKISAHRRSAFRPSYTEDDRWVQRLMVV